MPIIDICYRIQYLEAQATNDVCFICAVRHANSALVTSTRVTIKSTTKPKTCEHCGNFIHDSLNIDHEQAPITAQPLEKLTPTQAKTRNAVMRWIHGETL